ncbi:MAG TPA: hypothetical protein VMT85_15795 [Thermoanaerobaculia bacterium]|nr:hypothetical protein [Thermoanaerobaculia bacterium]
MEERARLIEKLRRIEALHLGAATDGERDAAAEGIRRIKERLASVAPSDPPVESRFSIENSWSRRLFIALLRRYELEPYRYHRQRATSIMVRLPRSMAKPLWQEFVELDSALREHLDAVAEQVISEAISADTADVKEVRGQLGEGG